MFVLVHGVAKFSLDRLEMAEIPTRGGQAVGMIECLGETDAFLAPGGSLLEPSLPGKHQSHEAADRHGRKCGEAKAFLAQPDFEPLHDFQEKILCTSKIPHPHAGRAEVESPHHLEWNIAERLGKCRH